MIPLLLLSLGFAQDSLLISASLRPETLRVGNNVVVTVRVASVGAVPTDMELDFGPEFELADTRDRFVTTGPERAVWERDYTLTAWEVGKPGFTVRVFMGDNAVAQHFPGPTVQSGGGWQAVRPDSDRPTGEAGPVPQGVPVPVGPDGQRAVPGVPHTVFPGQPGYYSGGTRFPGSRYPGSRRSAAYPGGLAPGAYGAQSGWMPGGWAERADADPWWPELVPELFHYDALAEDPSGFLRLEAGVTPEEVYVGQQITLFSTITVLPEAIARMGDRPHFVPPELSAFRRVREVFGAAEFPSASDGRLANSFSFQQAYFPQEAGEWAVPTGSLRFGFSGRGADEELSGPSTRVRVLPVPMRSAPQGYTGAVGRYEVRAEVLTPRVAWGDMGILRVEVTGVGDLRALQPPAVLQVWGAELTPLDDWTWIEVRQGVVGGVRVFDYGIVPLEALTVEVGPLVLTFFDPYVGAFRSVASGELTMEVVPPR